MTRKDFELIADIIRNLSGLHANDRRKIAEAFAAELRSTNSRFDSERFVRAATAKPHRHEWQLLEGPSNGGGEYHCTGDGPCIWKTQIFKALG